MPKNTSPRRIERHSFTTSRALDYLDRRKLEVQTSTTMDQWALVVGKELGDNAADVCEENGIAPEITFNIDTKRGMITVTDNGPGIPADTVKAILDFDTLTSSRANYVIPTRGAQGNALKTLLAMPYVMGKEGGDKAGAVTIIEARGIRHSISLRVDAVKQQPVVSHTEEPGDRKTGTSFTVPWPKSACSQLNEQKQRFVQFAHGFAVFNPHATIKLSWNGQEHSWPASDPLWSKWRASNETPARWYDGSSFERLVAAEARKDGTHTVREFVSDFRGLSRSDKVAQVLAATGLARTAMADLFRDGKPTSKIAKLLTAMQDVTDHVKPETLGVIGKAHLRTQFELLGYDADKSFQYQRVITTDENNLPVVIEVAFGYSANNYGMTVRTVFTGINFSPAITNPFKHLGSNGETLERILAGQLCESADPIIIAVHLTCPRINYLEHGKGGIALRGADTIVEQVGPDENDTSYSDEVDIPSDGSVAAQLIAAVKAVTARWLKQKDREIRSSTARAYRNAAMARTGRESQKAVAFDVMERAYMDASTKDTLPANARQIMYAARDEIQRRTGEQLKNGGSYFTQTLLPDFINEFQPSWGNKVLFDDRGHFQEPHTEHEIGLGTAAVRQYLGEIGDGDLDLAEAFEVKVTTSGPRNRFGAVLFVEKEGFDDLFQAAQIAERYDIAIMSTKGISVVAARELVDKVCGENDIPLFILTDFDKAGFTGAATFTKDNRRYTRENDADVITIGLRLVDVRALGIEDRAEDTFDKGDPVAVRANLKDNGATDAEIAFLLSGITENATGRRIELNALTSGELVALVERKLEQHGVKKIIPDKTVLANAYQLFKRGAAIRETVEEEIAAFDDVPVPPDLEKRVRALLKEKPAMPWDEAVAVIAGWRVED